ncbi:hypothetical protein [Aurantiacibacter sp. MUD61]|uniref:hypothetical protein n=1 Tax=Aurantiacibacter sp. MUD61 TaxID=3009083 RepID=UPI0022F0E9FE|nr:hypothetical protein [Aurantiacibacter sp. MUD61]
MAVFSRSILTLAAAAAIAPAAHAQDADPNQDIIVEGEGLEEPGMVRDLVQELSDTNRSDVPATRFFDALCLSVSGLNDAGNAYVLQRMEDNARSIGLRVQEPGCRANALVLIHDAPADLVEQIIEDVPHLLPRETRLHVRRQLADGDQVLLWHNEEDRNQGGRRNGTHDTMPGDDQVGGSLNVQASINVNSWPSRNALAFSRGVVSAAIIFDGEIVEGMVIERLADYATMRLLAPQLLPLDGVEPEPASIVAPFPEEGGPDQLTRFDQAYLSALYSMRPNAPATRLAQAVAEEYEGEE